MRGWVGRRDLGLGGGGGIKGWVGEEELRVGWGRRN